jgi:hypothetical protein
LSSRAISNILAGSVWKQNLSLIATTVLQIHSHLTARQGLPAVPQILGSHGASTNFRITNMQLRMIKQSIVFLQFPPRVCHYARKISRRINQLPLIAILVPFVSTCLYVCLGANGFSPDQQTVPWSTLLHLVTPVWLLRLERLSHQLSARFTEILPFWARTVHATSLNTTRPGGRALIREVEVPSHAWF